MCSVVYTELASPDIRILQTEQQVYLKFISYFYAAKGLCWSGGVAPFILKLVMVRGQLNNPGRFTAGKENPRYALMAP